MTDDEKALDRCSKHSALAVLGAGAVTTVLHFGLPFFVPLVALPLFALGVLQRFTERPWLAAGAVAWAAALAVFFKEPALAIAAAPAAYFFARHWAVLKKAAKGGREA